MEPLLLLWWISFHCFFFDAPVPLSGRIVIREMSCAASITHTGLDKNVQLLNIECSKSCCLSPTTVFMEKVTGKIQDTVLRWYKQLILGPSPFHRLFVWTSNGQQNGTTLVWISWVFDNPLEALLVQQSKKQQLVQKKTHKKTNKQKLQKTKQKNPKTKNKKPSEATVKIGEDRAMENSPGYFAPWN